MQLRCQCKAWRLIEEIILSNPLLRTGVQLSILRTVRSESEKNVLCVVICSHIGAMVLLVCDLALG